MSLLRTLTISRRRRRRAARMAFLWLRTRRARRLLKLLVAAPLAVRIIVGTIVVLTVWSTANWLYQVVRKPTELFFPVDGVLAKAPAETWRQYGPLFRRHSTAVITPELLAALAQVEGSGNPVARTYWRWRLTWNPFEVYQPASSAVGMYQITDATFREARRFCIRDHVVVEDGPWHDTRSCWFNGLYTRVLPSHAVEMTAALLDRGVAGTERGSGRRHPSLRRRSGGRLRAARLPADAGTALRRPRHRPLPGPGQRHEAAVRPAGRRRVAKIGGRCGGSRLSFCQHADGGPSDDDLLRDRGAQAAAALVRGLP